MNRLAHKSLLSQRRAHRVRQKLHGTAAQPRLSISLSNLHISAQLIDDDKQVTLASATTIGSKSDGSMTDKAKWLGEQIAKKATKAKIKKITFDRGSHLYHGRIKALADAARKNGLEF